MGVWYGLGMNLFIQWEKLSAVYRIAGGAIVVACIVGGIVEGKEWKVVGIGAALGIVVTLLASLEHKSKPKPGPKSEEDE